jgi:hypothetical protein
MTALTRARELVCCIQSPPPLSPPLARRLKLHPLRTVLNSQSDFIAASSAGRRHSMSSDRRGSGSGSLAASYASRSHREQQEQQATVERGEQLSQEPGQYPVRLPTAAGVAHVPANLTNGMVVDPADKVSSR